MDTQSFENFMSVVKNRRSCREFKSDPLPPGALEKILEAGRWAMSGNNCQPWEFIVVTKPETRQALNEAYRVMHREYIFWMEQMRDPKFRHSVFQGAQPGATVEEQLAMYDTLQGWADAPALIAVLGDGRKQWGTIMAAHTMGRQMHHLSDGLSNACQIMHLAASAMGLGSRWISIQVQEEFKRILNIPDLLELQSIIAVGHPASPPRAGSRKPLEEIVHHETYDMKRYPSSRQVVEGLMSRRKADKTA